jgi:hypothetical protein
MSDESNADKADGSAVAEPKVLSPEALRALAEAAERRAKQEAEAKAAAEKAQELGGRAGPDPVRYGDWENGGIASDF